MKYLLTVLVSTAIFFSACSSNDEVPKEPQISTVENSVILLMAGNNDLSNTVSADLDELHKGIQNMNADSRIIAIAVTSTQKYVEVIENGKVEKKAFTDFSESFSTANAEHITNVIRAIESKYPSRNWNLVLWGHANGWLIKNDSIANNLFVNAPRRAYGQSVENSKIIYINIPSLARALKSTGIHFGNIFADCCNFMCVESIYELRDVADYILGSPAEIPEEGANYSDIASLLPMKGCDSLKRIAEKYCAYYDARYTGINGVPLTIVKLSEMDKLAEATRPVMEQISKKEELNMTGLIHYYSSNLMYDMNDVIMHNVDSAVYAQWYKSFEQAVVFRHAVKRWTTGWQLPVIFDFEVTDARYGGLSMFFPMNVSDYVQNGYNDNVYKFQWPYVIGM